MKFGIRITTHSSYSALLSIVIALLFASCKREPCGTYPDETQYLNDTKRNSLVYGGHDTLRFLKNGADTITFISGERTTYFNATQNAKNMDCLGPKIYWEGNEVDFVDFTGAYKIFTNVSLGNIGSWISITIPNHSKFTWSSSGVILANDTLSVLNVQYDNVCKFTTEYEYGDTLYYDKHAGIIRLKMASNSLELIK